MKIIFLIISILSPVIPIAMGAKKRITLLWIYAITGLFFDLCITIMKRVFEVNHNWMANLFVLTEFLLISLFYREKIFRNNKLFLSITVILGGIFLYTTLRQSIFYFNTTGSAIFCFTYISYGILGLYKMLQAPQEVYIEQSSFFWVNAAFIIYASGTLLLFLFREYLQQQNSQLFTLLWSTFFLTLNVLKNIFLAISFKKSAV